MGKIGVEACAPSSTRSPSGSARASTRVAGVRAVKTEGHLLYGGLPRPGVADAGILVGGTAAGLVDATNGEGISKLQ